MPLNNFAVSSFPVMRGGRVGAGSRCRNDFQRRNVLQAFERDPAINNGSEERAENHQHQPPPRPQTNSSHAITFLPRRQ